MSKVGSTSLLYLEVLTDFFELRNTADLVEERPRLRFSIL